MADAIEELRTAAEDDFTKLLRRLNREQSARVEAAVNAYGSVSAIPDAFWRDLQGEINEQATTLLLLLLVGSYRAEASKLSRRSRFTATEKRQVAELAGREGIEDAARPIAVDMARKVGEEYTRAIRDRLRKRIDDRLGLPDEVVSVGDEVADVLDDEQAERTVSTTTTEVITVGQSSAGGDAGIITGRAIDVVWRTEDDSRVCPVCRPLHGKRSTDWEETLARQVLTQSQRDWAMTGPPAHPNCRCRLEQYPQPTAN